MHLWFWLCLLAGAAGSQVLLWLTPIPLGIPGEWVWYRVPPEPDVWWNLLGIGVAAGLYAAYVEAGSRRLERTLNRRSTQWELPLLLTGLILASFVWIWVVQETAPTRSRLGKGAFVLYYASSSGYFTKARYESPDPSVLLSGYEDLMRERDVLHVGTHPPGLFLVFQGLISVCDRSTTLASFLDQTQPNSFVKACDVIAQNIARTRSARLLLPSDRRVLWLASLLVMAMASLTGLVLYALVRRTHGVVAGWWTAALWPAIPSIAIFQPKSDVAFALIGVLIVWVWLTALGRRSILLAILAGLLAWCGLMMSLAVLPVFLFTAIISLLERRPQLAVLKDSLQDAPVFPGAERTESESLNEGVRLRFEPPSIRCLIGAMAGVAIPTLLLGQSCRINMLTVWWLNYQNHAGFYQEYTRTYWKWLLANPVELSFAAGWPLFLVAAVAIGLGIRSRTYWSAPLAWSVALVWGTLWLTGKNSGEAARLWIVFLPWLVWLAGPTIAEGASPIGRKWLRPALVVLIIQLVVCALTVSRMNGFVLDA